MVICVRVEQTNVYIHTYVRNIKYATVGLNAQCKLFCLVDQFDL